MVYPLLDHRNDVKNYVQICIKTTFLQVVVSLPEFLTFRHHFYGL